MKRVINGKLYDTDGGEKIASYNPVADRGDFNFLHESLYKTPNGRYFLHGEGGPLTPYAVKHGNETSGSSEIRPMTAEEALRWAEKRSIDGAIVAEEFGDLIEQA